VDVYAVAEALARHPGLVEEHEEELDQGRVAVYEADISELGWRPAAGSRQ